MPTRILLYKCRTRRKMSEQKNRGQMSGPFFQVAEPPVCFPNVLLQQFDSSDANDARPRELTRTLKTGHDGPLALALPSCLDPIQTASTALALWELEESLTAPEEM